MHRLQMPLGQRSSYHEMYALCRDGYDSFLIEKKLLYRTFILRVSFQCCISQ